MKRIGKSIAKKSSKPSSLKKKSNKGEESLTIDSSNPAQLIESYRNKGIEYASKGKFKTSEKYFKQILDIDQNNVDAMALLGELYERGFNELDKASLWLKRSISSGSKNPDTYVRLGRLYLREEFEEYDIRMAKQCFEKAMNLKGGDDLYFELGMINYDIEDYDKALEYFNQSRYKDPFEERRETSLIMLADIYTRKGQNDPKFYDDAIDVYNHIIKKNNSHEIKIELAKCYLKRKMFNEAQGVLDEIKDKYPNHTEVLISYADLFMQTNKLDEAFDIISQILSKNEKHIYANYLIGKIHFERSLYMKAIENFTKVLANNNFDQTLSKENNSNNELLNLGDPLNPSEIIDVNYKLGICYYKTGKLKDARNHLKKIVEEDDSNPEAHLLYGEVLEHLNEREEALKHYRMSSILNPYLLKASFLAGCLCAQMEQYEQAIVYFEKVISNYDEAKRLGVDLKSRNEKEMMSRAFHNISAAYQRLAHVDPSKSKEHMQQSKKYYDLSKGII